MIVFSLVCLVTTSPTHLMLLRHQLSSMLDNIMRDWSIKSVGDFLQTLWLNVVFSLCLFVILLISCDQGCNCEKLCLKGNPEVPESWANLLQIWQNNHKKMHSRDICLITMFSTVCWFCSQEMNNCLRTFQIFQCLSLTLKRAYSAYSGTSTNIYMSHLLLLGKFEYTGGPIFKVVLEC